MNLKLISNLNFGEKLNSNNPVTESGKEMLKNYKAYTFNNDITYGLVNGFIREASQFTFDTGVMSILESVLTYVNENKISWKLASACESINNNNSQYNYISKMGVNQVEKLLEMKENEVIQYIKAGALKNIQFIPEFRSICKEVYQTNTIQETYAPNYRLTTPLSYVLVNEDGTHFSILGKSYRFVNDVVEECEVDDVNFLRINSILPNFVKVDENLEFSYKQGIMQKELKFIISEKNITFKTGSFNQVFESSAGFKEYADVYARTLMGPDKGTFINVVSNISEMFENFNNISEVDTAKVLETSKGEVIGIIEAESNVNMTVFKSITGASSKNYQFMNEALSDINKITGISLNSVYENRLNEDVKRMDPNSYESIKEQLAETKKAQIEIRRKKIEMLAEQYKYNPNMISILNGAAKELAILESQL